MIPKLDEFTQSYLETALWVESDQSDDQGGEPLEENYTIEDIDPDSLKEAIVDCKRFQTEYCLHTDADPIQAGHDFWLTRNGHGVGFWDGNWPKEIRERLTKASRQFGHVDIYVGDNDTLYFSQGNPHMKTIGEFELVDHGIEYFQYFQGCGTTFTGFENVATGIGNNPAEAIDDCLEQIAQCGFDTEGMETRIMEQKDPVRIPTIPNVFHYFPDNDDCYYHISIRYNEEI